MIIYAQPLQIIECIEYEENIMIINKLVIISCKIVKKRMTRLNEI